MMPHAVVCSGSLKFKVDNGDVKEVLAGKRPIRNLFQHEQRSFYEEHAPTNVDLDFLTPFGPITVAKLKFSARRFWKRMAVAELWFYPDASRILELSTKCAQDEAFQVLAEARGFLRGHGIYFDWRATNEDPQGAEYFSRLHARDQR